jgi:hypothetical protein
MQAATARRQAPTAYAPPPTKVLPVTVDDVLRWMQAGVSATGALHEALRRHGYKAVPFGRVYRLNRAVITDAINGQRRATPPVLKAFVAEFGGTAEAWSAVFYRALTEDKPPVATG